LAGNLTPHYSGNNPVMFNDVMDRVDNPTLRALIDGTLDTRPNPMTGGGGDILASMIATESQMNPGDIRPGYSGFFMMGAMQLAKANGDISGYEYAQYASQFGTKINGRLMQ
jgi:hypothetical protein